MSTWHHDKSQTRLYDDVLWTVVTDPPNGTRVIQRFHNEDQCQFFIRRLRTYSPEEADRSYVLPPYSSGE